MWTIEIFVGSARGLWARSRQRFQTKQAAEQAMADDWQTEARHLAGVFVRRVVAA